MRSAVSILLALVLLTTGCQSAPQAESIEDLADRFPAKHRVQVYLFDPEAYPVVFEAAVETLRDHGYRIARRDYRFGSITTFPKEAATSAEFWIDDAKTRAQRSSDTLNAQQRTVTVTVDQPEDAAHYALTVQVAIQRLQRPDRYLTHSASPSISRSYTDTPMHLKDRGIDGPYAQDLDRDRRLEERLLEAIEAASQ